MINTGDSLDSDPEVFLIDYGFAQKYVKKDGKTHIEESTEVDAFMGNINFSTVRQMSFKMTSRKDDLISLFYLLIYMLNNGNLWVGDEDPGESYKNIDKSF